MAQDPAITLFYESHCPDCARREADMPLPLPQVGDDFDWQVRDYDSFRLFMLQELAARFPERRRWTASDLEVVIVEVLATVLDQLSDMLDRVEGEAALETARHPASIRRHLQAIGYDAVRQALAADQIALSDNEDKYDVLNSAQQAELRAALELFWWNNPSEMERARRAGPAAIRTQVRMVSLEDHAARLEDHPLVARAAARSKWSGSWSQVRIMIVGYDNQTLDETLQINDVLKETVDQFHERLEVLEPNWDGAPSLRTILQPYVDALRLLGQEVILEDTQPIPISMWLSIRVKPNYYRGEVRRGLEQALGTGPEGFFAAGRLDFGEDLLAGDIIAAAMAVTGVEDVCLNRFKRAGSAFPDQRDSGRIVLTPTQIAVCENEPGQPERGYFRLSFNGGRRG